MFSNEWFMVMMTTSMETFMSSYVASWKFFLAKNKNTSNMHRRLTEMENAVFYRVHKSKEFLFEFTYYLFWNNVLSTFCSTLNEIYKSFALCCVLTWLIIGRFTSFRLD